MNNKLIIFLALMILRLSCPAKSYYISVSGNDQNDGLSPVTSWKTFSKINSFFKYILPGDSILFKRGDIFYGSIKVIKSGTENHPIVFAAFGEGEKPIITGFTTLTSWALIEKGIYQVPIIAKNTLNMVTVNDIPQAVGRFPNADAPDGGYLKYTSFTGNTSFTCSALGNTNWAGAEVISKKEGYILERDIITSQSEATITYRSVETINPRQSNTSPQPEVPPGSGFGLFIQRDPRTLDQAGEWYFDTVGKKLQIFFGINKPSAYKIKASTLDTLIDLSNTRYIIISNIAFEGANIAAIYFDNANNITIKNNNISNSGAKGIFGWNSSNILVDNNIINNSMCSAIDITSRHGKNITVSNNKIKNTGILPGMSSFFDDNDCNAISISVDSIAVISKNIVDTTGYIPIHFWGAGIIIDSNLINYFAFVKDDGGGIYTVSTYKTNRVIKNNIVLHGIGAPNGNQYPIHAEGIYIDGGGRGVDILNNTCAFMSNHGIYLNDPKDINVNNNICYSTCGWGVNKHFNDSIYNFTLKHNIFYNVQVQSELRYTYGNSGLNSTNRPVAGNIQLALQLLGNIDSNYYRMAPNNFTWNYTQRKGEGATYFKDGIDLEKWQSYTGLDKNSKIFGYTDLIKPLFEYNASNKQKIISLEKFAYKSPDGKIFTGTYSIPPFSSVILMRKEN